MTTSRGLDGAAATAAFDCFVDDNQSLECGSVESLTPGAYEQVITNGIAAALDGIAEEQVQRGRLDASDADEILVGHLRDLVRRVLRSASGDEGARLRNQVDVANQIGAYLASLAPDFVETRDLVADSIELLRAIAPASLTPAPPRFPDRPRTPLSASALLVNGRGQPSIGSEVNGEIDSADDVDLLCAFVKWEGVRVIQDRIKALTERSGRLRVISTTYMGATDRRALDRLVELGADVKVSYETRNTRLHAKAWMFHRATGFSTAYVGSSNLSKTAMLDGLEWNVRLSQVEQSHLLATIAATFEEYWQDPSFETYDPNVEAEVRRLDEAIAHERGGSPDLAIELTSLEVRPFGYQREILEELRAERELHDRHENLVVMATGTGKTVVSALDYKRLRVAGVVDSVLFVAHRDELLQQSIATFRHVLRDGSFGERFVGGQKPKEWRHVFASVQSLAQLDLAQLDPRQFDMVIVDEFHHAGPETRTYARLLHHLNAKELVGLTATPERMDGQDVKAWFGGRIAVELRLWEALERGLLSPFQYFGHHDSTDLAAIRWKRGAGYDASELTNLYTGHDARTRIVLQVLQDRVTNVGVMKALGFCVSIDHAEFMTRKFNEAGVAARAVTSRSTSEQRRADLLALKSGQTRILFTVDLFNEGVDLPDVDTVLFLRPTESATVFLQQLGRGLRLSDNKPCLTVLDFIGNQTADFRFDQRYRALTGLSRRALGPALEAGFPTLPAGCHIELDRLSSEIVLKNVTSSLRINWRTVASELRDLGDVALGTFLRETGFELEDIYRRRNGGWTRVRREAGFDNRPTDNLAEDAWLAGAIGRMLHIDDLERLDFIESLMRCPEPPDFAQFDGRQRRLLWMAFFLLRGWELSPNDDLEEAFAYTWRSPARCEEIVAVCQELRERTRRVTLALPGEVPLHVHANYSLAELAAAFGIPNPTKLRGTGVTYVQWERADLLFSTLTKTERHFSPTTMYRDRAVSPHLFQWDSQNNTSAETETGRRYVNHVREGSSVHLFFRESKEPDGALGAPPYFYAGPAEYVSHEGSKPMHVLWRLKYELPADAFHSAKVAAG